jgi:hypothetical protein
MKACVLGSVWLVALAGGAHAGSLGAPLALARAAGQDRPILADWQDPAALPRQFRNHCAADWWGRPYCSDHCGRGYQLYYCSPDSFGCCHVGYGYCDDRGHLRCHP